jgi:hypothetical protein
MRDEKDFDSSLIPYPSEGFDDKQCSVVVEKFPFGEIGDGFADEVNHFFGGKFDSC